MNNYYLKAILLEGCPYSIAAKDLLKTNNISVEIINVNNSNNDKNKKDQNNDQHLQNIEIHKLQSKITEFLKQIRGFQHGTREGRSLTTNPAGTLGSPTGIPDKSPRR